ncbi:MAG: PRC-barrel domain-containing protein [Rhizobium sp.]|nr:PRC-barrel domain-containing protein [Rhizobium sp.]
MKRILATTALVMIMAGGAYSAQMGNYTSQMTDVEASDFIGSRIYAAETMPATDMVQVGAEKDWDDVGEINDVILGRDGQIKAVILGVGGFLGIGEKSVAIPMQDVKFVKNGDGADDFFLVVNANKDVLTNAPAYVSVDEKVADQAAATDAAAPATDTTMTAPADTTADATTTAPAADTTTAMTNDAATTTTNDAAATDTTTTASTSTDNATQAMTDENRTRLIRPDVTRDGYRAAEAAEITADKLEGARVYGPNDEDVGEVNRLILDNNGQVQQVVLDVGGFLGMGEREIAVTPDELNIVRTDDGTDFRVYVDANEANLKAQPEFKG